MKNLWVLCLLISPLCLQSGSFAQASTTARKALEIYYVDTEGGAATLIVTPAGESILVDAGWPGFNGRDAARIETAMKKAGITAIDHLIVTHYHVDHYGGVPEIAKRVKVNNFYDHGPMSALEDDRDFATRYAAYQAATQGKSIALKPGSTIKLKTAKGAPPVQLLCLAARAEVISDVKMSGPRNSACDTATQKPEDKSDNARSLVFLLRYGAFEFLDTGDLTWNIEHKLACPLNLVGPVDLYQVGHHGMNSSNNPVLLRSVSPTVAIMNNGPRKGGHPDSVKWLRELPSLKDLYQVHRNVTSTDEQNAPPEFIANLDEKNDEAYMIRVAVDAAKRVFSVSNDRTGKSKSYPIK